MMSNGIQGELQYRIPLKRLSEDNFLLLQSFLRQRWPENV